MTATVKFTYPHRQFLIKGLAMLILLVCILLFTLFLTDAGWFWPSMFFFIFLIFILMSISPIFTRHEIDSQEITLRQGLLFSTKIPFSEIGRVERQTGPVWKFGFRCSRAWGRIVLAGGNTGLVIIRLKSRKRFKSLLFKSGNEIVIDVNRPDEFVELANRHLLLYQTERQVL